LVVIAIIALLVSILMPSLAKARLLARKAICGVNQRSVGMQIQLYAANHDDTFMGPFAPTPLSETTGHRYDDKTFVTLLLDQMTPGHAFPTWQYVHNFDGSSPGPYADLATTRAKFELYKQVAGIFFCPVAPMSTNTPRHAGWGSAANASIEAEATTYHFTTDTWIWTAPRGANTWYLPGRVSKIPLAANSVMLAETFYHLWPDASATPANAPFYREMTLGSSWVDQMYFHHGANDLNYLYFDGHVGASIQPPYILGGKPAGWDTYYEEYIGMKRP